MRREVTVLYEDRRGPAGRFPFHDLILALVRDALERKSPPDLASIVHASPRNGAAKLLYACEHEAERLANLGPLVAVFDEDQIRTLLGLDPTVPQEEVLASLSTRVGSPALEVRLLDRNLESVIHLCREAGLEIPDATFTRATERKKRQARDEIFQAAAHHGATRRHIARGPADLESTRLSLIAIRDAIVTALGRL